MLSKINRIKDKKLFPLILKKGTKFYCPFFIFIIAKDLPQLAQDESRVPQFGFITSKKVGGAVQRNKVRRVLSEIVRLELPNLKPEAMGIFIAHKNAVTASYESLEIEIKKVFKNSGLSI
jgi:ribonuclease P protein component